MRAILGLLLFIVGTVLLTMAITYVLLGRWP